MEPTACQLECTIATAADPPPARICPECRRVQDDDGYCQRCQSYVPTPEEIAAHAALIREEWTDAERENRAGLRTDWMTQLRVPRVIRRHRGRR